MTLARTLSLAVVAALVAACGGSSPDTATGPTPPPPPAGQTIVVATAPAEGEVEPGASMQFSAQVTGTANGAVRWSVDEASGGTVSATGLYTAPATEGTYHVRAESVAALEASGAIRSAVRLAGGSSAVKGGSTSAVHVKRNAVTPPPPVSVSVNPATATVLAGGTQGFAAAVSGSTNLGVTWTVQEGPGCGSVSASGVYTAPNAGATCHVVVTSAADPTKSASATVTVSPPPVTAVAVSPASPSVVAGASITFTATITGTAAGQSAGVTWSVPAGAGTINASTGVYVAPATAGTYVVTATSVADGTRKGTASVTVTALPVTVVVSPTTATLDACRGQVFTATVSNASDKSVTWSVVEAGGGTVVNGAYSAPTTPGTYHLLAVSRADPTRTAQATITVGAEKVVSVAVNPASGTVNANGTLTLAATVTTTCATYAAQ